MFFRIRSPYLHQFCNENSSITIGSIAIGAETTGYCGNLGRDDASHPALSNMHRSEPYKDAGSPVLTTQIPIRAKLLHNMCGEKQQQE